MALTAAPSAFVLSLIFVMVWLTAGGDPPPCPAMDSGRVTLSDRSLIVTDRGRRRESGLTDEAPGVPGARGQFGIMLGR